MAKTNKPTQFLRVDFSEKSRKHINDYLQAEYPDHGKVMAGMVELLENASKIIVSHYEGQVQVSAYFVGLGDGESYGVSGLGDTLDLAILSCFTKAAFDLGWKFGAEGGESVPVNKPRFS